MADLVQDFKAQFIPKFSLPQIDLYTALIVGMIIIFILLIFFIIYIWRTYRIRIIELEDLGKGYRAKIFQARPVTINGIPKYRLLGKKDEGSTFFHPKPLMINASPSDAVIPLRTALDFYKDLIIVHKDKAGDARPFKLFTSKDQINFGTYADTEGKVNLDKLFGDIFPTLQVDNIKMRGWYKLKSNEGLNIYHEPTNFLGGVGTGSLMFIMFIIFAVFINAYLIFK
jgi:hypothetical protein